MINYKNRKPIFGVGINDVDMPANITSEKGYKTNDPFYAKWKNMLRRAYDKKYHKKNIRYTDVIVCEEWLYFSNFKKWMLSQEWQGKELDKDIIMPGNKIYSPDRCVFVSQALNKLITSSNNSRGKYPLGVSFDKSKNKFTAKISINGKLRDIGTYLTIYEAQNAYIARKTIEIERHALCADDLRIKNGLMTHAELLNLTGCFK
jgi:hypothetical protein